MNVYSLSTDQPTRDSSDIELLQDFLQAVRKRKPFISRDSALNAGVLYTSELFLQSIEDGISYEKKLELKNSILSELIRNMDFSISETEVKES